ncbi:hypothetical protein Syun_021785 [Stephania yunnanensis]|uniref:Uncharacterized protein n=1 Tax=Stephania yunnanensis TaxID=152371 RepID=A0AAP0IGE3_9MAGN
MEGGGGDEDRDEGGGGGGGGVVMLYLKFRPMKRLEQLSPRTTTEEQGASMSSPPDHTGRSSSAAAAAAAGEKIAVVMKYVHLPFSIGVFIVVVGLNHSVAPTRRVWLRLCGTFFLISILIGATLLVVAKQSRTVRGNTLPLVFLGAATFASTMAGLGCLFLIT